MMLALLFAPLLAQNPVTVRLNHDQFTAGDRARVYVEAAQDGYLVVLHADAEGRVRVLFPLDPSDDDFVRGGKRFELRARGDRDAFQVEGDEGSGTVRSEEHTSELQSLAYLVCRLLLEKKTT